MYKINITRGLIKEIIKMDNPTIQYIDTLRLWVWTNFIDRLSLKVLRYLNKHNG